MRHPARFPVTSRSLVFKGPEEAVAFLVETEVEPRTDAAMGELIGLNQTAVWKARAALHIPNSYCRKSKPGVGGAGA